MSSMNYKIWRRNRLMHDQGTSLTEVIEVISPVFFYAVFTTTLISILCTYSTRSKPCIFTIEILLLVVPAVINMTILEKYIPETLFISVIITVTLLVFIYFMTNQKVKSLPQCFDRKPFITNARSTINLMSVIGILAVDFKIFPRRFAKTDNYGVSLMDVGAALYVYSNGIVSPEVRNKIEPFQKSIKNSLPLFVMGLGRFFLVKQTDYHVPVSEYGVHWNFFVTLAVVKLLGSAFIKVIKDYLGNNVLLGSILVISIHEFLLQQGLKNFIIAEIPRDNFITANREGIISSFGYLGIYLLSVYFGRLLNENCSKLITLKNIFSFLLACFSASIILHMTTGISRRSANAGFCFWILSLGVFMTGLFFAYDIILETWFKNKIIIYTPLIYNAINENALVFFLIGNVLTGLINFSVDTMSINHIISLIIIVSYMALNCITVCLLSSYNISILRLIKVR